MHRRMDSYNSHKLISAHTTRHYNTSGHTERSHLSLPTTIKMATKSDEIMAKFTAKTLPIISGEPDYEIINLMVQMLYLNA